MINIKNTNLYIGTENDFLDNLETKAMVSVNTANNLHAKVLGFRPKNTDEGYILYIKDKLCSANFVDADKPEYFDYNNNGVNVFNQIMDLK